MNPLLASRRERLRAATIAEIKQAAREQVALGGVQAISLRGVARTIGLAPSALYRYFDSHDVLVDELAADAFASLADALEAAYPMVAGEPEAARCFLLLVRTYRSWAHAHETEFMLLFGARKRGEHEPSARCTAEMHRATGVLFLCMIDAIGAGHIDPSRLEALVTPGLGDRLVAWGIEENAPLPAAALAGCLLVWTHLQGFITLELLGQLPPSFAPDDDQFDEQMLAALVSIGYRPPIDRTAVCAPSPASLRRLGESPGAESQAATDS